MPYNKTIWRLKELEPEIVEADKDKKTLMELKRESKSTTIILSAKEDDVNTCLLKPMLMMVIQATDIVLSVVCRLAGKNRHGGRSGIDRGRGRERDRNKRKWMLRDNAKEMVKSVLPNKKSSDSDSSNSGGEQAGYRKQFHVAKQFHVMAFVGIDPEDDDETSVDSQQIRKYKKVVQKYCSKNDKYSC